MKKTKKVLNELSKIGNSLASNKDKIIKELTKMGFKKISPVDYVYDKKGGYCSIGAVTVKISDTYVKVSCCIGDIRVESDKMSVKNIKMEDIDELIHKTFVEVKNKLKADNDSCSV